MKKNVSQSNVSNVYVLMHGSPYMTVKQLCTELGYTSPRHLYDILHRIQEIDETTNRYNGLFRSGRQYNIYCIRDYFRYKGYLDDELLISKVPDYRATDYSEAYGSFYKDMIANA